MALHSGLSAAIINPLSETMSGVFRAYLALAGYDKNCSEYVKRYSGTAETPKTKNTTTDGLFEMIIKGLKYLSYDEATRLLKDNAPLDIINTHIIPALDAVGRDFESQKLFLPQLLMSAETAQNAFAAIRKFTPQERGGEKTYWLPCGDIHDIENIVKLLLQNYGYDVVDLGRCSRRKNRRNCNFAKYSFAALAPL